MLTWLRGRVSGLLSTLAKPLSRLRADFYTYTGLLLAAFFPLAVSENGLAGVAVLLLSGFFDAVDGAVARVRGEASSRGGFIDSVTDRVADIIYSLGFLAYGYPPLLVTVSLGFSLLTSYIRARYEAATGESMEGVGLMERADRIAFLALVLLVDYAFSRQAGVALYAVYTALVIATALHRVYVALARLVEEEKKQP